MADVAITALTGNVVVSEILPYIKKVKANSLLQLIWNVLKLLASMKDSGKKNPAKVKSKV